MLALLCGLLGLALGGVLLSFLASPATQTLPTLFPPLLSASPLPPTLPVSPALGAGCVAAAALAAFGLAVDCSRQLASPRTCAAATLLWKKLLPHFSKDAKAAFRPPLFPRHTCAKPS